MRMRLLSKAELGWFPRLCAWLMKRQSGEESPMPLMLGRHPAVLGSVMGYGAGYLRWKALPARLKRLVHLRTAMRVGCPS
jgi:hypothetical protein